MTSGQFHNIDIDQVKVPRELRQRRQLGDITVLAESIHRLGLIHPIVVTRDYMLVAGERRLAACKQLGHDRISCQYVDEVEDHVLKAIELEENIKRLNIGWEDECKAILNYHNHREATEKDWTQDKTAVAIGMAPISISDRIKVAKSLIDDDSKLREVNNFSTALGIIRRDEERDNAAKEERRTRGFSIAEIKGEHKHKIITADFTEWVKTYDGPRFNFIHCDFPYGTNTDKRQQGNIVEIQGGYDDSPETYRLLLTVFCNNIQRLCADSAHIMFWFSMHYYTYTLNFFANHSDFIIDPFPLVWLKSDGSGILPDPQRGPRRTYETCLFGSRGDRKIVSSVANAFAASTDNKIHMSTKPEEVLCHFFRMFVDRHSVVLDPTCGSGSSVRAAKSLGAEYALGIEINKEYAIEANLSI
jgi:ParB family chromosome partitioning protein